jgi:Transposase DDE domain
MHQRILSIVAQIRQDVANHLSPAAILETCKAVGHVWRDCVLEPVTTIHVLIIQVLNGNTALNHLRHLTGLGLTAQAFCDARTRLPLEVFRRLLQQLVPTLRVGQAPPLLWFGHRTFAVDGSSFSMPDTPDLQREFGQSGSQRKGCGFPVAHFLAMFDSATGFLLEILASPLRTHDMSKVAQIHPGLRAGDVLVGDRGFCSFAHVALLVQRGIHCVFRLHQRLKLTVLDSTDDESLDQPKLRRRKQRPAGLSRVLHRRGMCDQILTWDRPKTKPAWMSQEDFRALPLVLLCRVLSYDLRQRGYRTKKITLVTTLLDADAYPWEELATLYGRRWQVEINFRHLKTTMNMDVLRCLTVEGVLKELMIFAIVYNLVRVVMVEAARRQRVGVDRISFMDTLRWLVAAGPRAVLIRLIVNPDRPGRVEPRVKKRRPKQYDLMMEPRSVLRNRLMDQGVVA